MLTKRQGVGTRSGVLAGTEHGASIHGCGHRSSLVGPRSVTTSMFLASVTDSLGGLCVMISSGPESGKGPRVTSRDRLSAKSSGVLVSMSFLSLWSRAVLEDACVREDKEYRLAAGPMNSEKVSRT